MESGDFDYMLIGRDDTAAYSQAHREAREMDILVNELPKEKIRFFAGADQLGLLLLSRAANRLQYELPLVNVTYAVGKGGKTVPTYEDDTVAVSAKQHIYAAGGFPVYSRKNADFPCHAALFVLKCSKHFSKRSCNYVRTFQVA